MGCSWDFGDSLSNVMEGWRLCASRGRRQLAWVTIPTVILGLEEKKLKGFWKQVNGVEVFEITRWQLSTRLIVSKVFKGCL